MPDDLGARVGIRLDGARPYVGPLVGASLSTGVGGQTFVVAGGDLGVDMPVESFRLGLEARVFWNLTSDVSRGSVVCPIGSAACDVPYQGTATFGQLLLSVRYVL